MPAPRYRSRSLKRKYVKTPGGKTVLHYKNKKPRLAVCASCGGTLKGMPNLKPDQLKRLPKSSRRPSRPHPELCSKCQRKKTIEEVRKNV